LSSTWGKNIKISIFGESHGQAIGVVVDGFPAGIKVDLDYISTFLKRRAPGGELATKRKEPDIPEIISGVFNGYTTGAPVAAIIRNTNQHSSDYGERLTHPRPSHADYTAYVKYNGFADFRGGGHFSGRLTAPLVFAGALCMLALKEKGVKIGAHICKIGDVSDTPFDNMKIDSATLDCIKEKDFPTLNAETAEKMKNLIKAVASDGDSIGAVIECAAVGLPVGIGAHMFRSAEGVISSIMFGIPAVKGIEFGLGFGFAESVGSRANDGFEYIDGEVKTTKNNCGGIMGGMTNGAPLVFRVAFKPTPSVYKTQNSVNLITQVSEEFNIKGRHDPCIAVRAVPVVEAAAAVALLDLMLDK